MIYKIVVFTFLIMLLFELGIWIVTNIARLFRVTPNDTPTKFWKDMMHVKRGGL